MKGSPCGGQSLVWGLFSQSGADCVSASKEGSRILYQEIKDTVWRLGSLSEERFTQSLKRGLYYEELDAPRERERDISEEVELEGRRSWDWKALKTFKKSCPVASEPKDHRTVSKTQRTQIFLGFFRPL